MTFRLVLFLTIYAAVLNAAVVPYKCETVPPADDCTQTRAGEWRMTLYGHEWYRHPAARVDAACVDKIGNRYRAHSVRLTTFYAHSTKVKTVETYDVQEFPERNAELCKVEP